jgi:putative transcriptional regulator
MDEPHSGRLLVATTVLSDPNFRRSVVLIVEHEAAQGTLGVILNRPTEIPVGQVLEPWMDLATSPSVVFSGGPVAPNSALALALVPGTDEPVGWHPLDEGAPAMARLGLVDLDAPPGLLADAIARLRVYAGYAGWAAGQLQAEIDQGAWYVLPGEPADAFAADPARLWQSVLRRQGGELAYVATYPDDPSQNLAAAAPPRKLFAVSSTEVLPEQDTKIHEDLRPDTSHGDHERFKHLVIKDKLVDSMVTGTPLRALCGKVWVPSHDPNRYPPCPTCMEIAERLPKGDDRDGDGES